MPVPQAPPLAAELLMPAAAFHTLRLNPLPIFRLSLKKVCMERFLDVTAVPQSVPGIRRQRQLLWLNLKKKQFFRLQLKFLHGMRKISDQDSRVQQFIVQAWSI
jgi:hypothetical protein